MAKPTFSTGPGLKKLKFGQEIVRNRWIKRHVVELDVPLGSELAALDDSRSADRVIFHAVEVHELEYPPGPKFR